MAECPYFRFDSFTNLLLAYRLALGFTVPERTLRKKKAEANFLGYTDLMVDGAPSPHQSDTTLRWLIDRLRS